MAHGQTADALPTQAPTQEKPIPNPAIGNVVSLQAAAAGPQGGSYEAILSYKAPSSMSCAS